MIWLVAVFGIVVVGAVGALVGMSLATDGDHEVPTTVDDDPSLPQVVIDGYARTTASSVTTPILFLAGACDTWIGLELQRKHAAWYPDARVGVIEEAGHDMYWDRPGASIRAVREFLTAG